MDKTEDEAVLIELDYGFDMPGAGAVVVDPSRIVLLYKELFTHVMLVWDQVSWGNLS